MLEKINELRPPAQQLDDLPASLLAIARTLSRERHLRPADMRKLVLSAQVSVEDLLPWADFDHSVADSYGRRMIYKGPHFEIMAMSWQPGDFSTIHDHGHTQWGCVQVFGPAEHATFRMGNGRITTLARWKMQTGDAIGVHHDLLHQMGNATDQPFLTLHVYGEPEDQESITGDARVLNLENNTIQRVDGGVFFELPPADIKAIEPAPPADFPTRLRHLIELANRVSRRIDAGETHLENRLNDIHQKLWSADQQASFLTYVKKITNQKGHITNTSAWKVLRWELKVAARYEADHKAIDDTVDHFHQYAELYDAVIGRPCLQNFISGYLTYVDQHVRPWSTGRILSLGVGTGLSEQYLMENHRVKKENIYGIDISGAMVEVARSRLSADVGNILELDPTLGTWDTVFSGLNVFHYLPFKQLEEAIQRTAAILNVDGLFVGDFITPDHIRWYPNTLIAANEKTISLRQPKLVEDEGLVFQESDIINVDFRHGHLHVHNAGTHRRFLPPLIRVRNYFEKYFSSVEVRDAHSLAVIPEWADSCASTRYIVIARK